MAMTLQLTIERAKRLSRARRHAEAVELLDEFLLGRPDEFEAYFQRGLAKHALGDRDSAIADLNAAIGLEPTQPALYWFRGVVFIEASRYADGIEDMDRTITADLALGSE